MDHRDFGSSTRESLKDRAPWPQLAGRSLQTANAKPDFNVLIKESSLKSDLFARLIRRPW